MDKLVAKGGMLRRKERFLRERFIMIKNKELE